MKLQERLEAIRLRRQGKSYKKIREKIAVSKSTLSTWLRDIVLSKKQLAFLLKGRERGQYAGAKANQRKRLEKIKLITQNAKEESKYLYRKSPLFLVGLMLYWAEGDKSKETERVKFTNSDPEMIKLIMRWFREVCKVPENRFRVCIHIHTLHCRPKVEKYWSKLTGIPLSQFHRTQIKPTSLRHRRNPLYDGTCGVSIESRDLFRRIMGWKLGTLESINVAHKRLSLPS